MEQGLSVWNDEVRECSDAQLVAQLQRLTGDDRKLLAQLVVYIGEMDARGLYRERAFPSMFQFLVGELRMSEGEAFLRLQAARLARTYPIVIELLAKGAVHLSALRLIAPLLTPENHAQLLQRVCGKTKREVLQLVAELAPKPETPARFHKSPQSMLPLLAAGSEPASAVVASNAATTEPQSTAARGSASGALDPDQAPAGSPGLLTLEAPREKRRGRCTPVGPGRYDMKLSIDQSTHDTLTQLQHLLRHQVPDGDLTRIVERAAKLLLSHELKRRFAQTTPRTSRRVTASPRPSTSNRQKPDREHAEPTQANTKNSRYIPNEVKREVYARDAGKCAFVGTNGRRCSERGGLEVHHIHPFARGGRATAENLKLMCRVHNQLLAEHDFRQDLILRKRAARAPAAPSPIAAQLVQQSRIKRS